MTKEEAIHEIEKVFEPAFANYIITALTEGATSSDKEQQPIDKSTMMYEIYMEGVNMSGEYQGCWVRFKNIEKIVDKYIAESEK